MGGRPGRPGFPLTVHDSIYSCSDHLAGRCRGAQDAELVALGTGRDHPAPAGAPARVHRGRAEAGQPGHLVVGTAVDRADRRHRVLARRGVGRPEATACCPVDTTLGELIRIARLVGGGGHRQLPSTVAPHAWERRRLGRGAGGHPALGGARPHAVRLPGER
ncbi:hypothetical protein SUDANB176_06646 [Streptomyces sp. enrichment culture]